MLPGLNSLSGLSGMSGSVDSGDQPAPPDEPANSLDFSAVANSQYLPSVM